MKVIFKAFLKSALESRSVALRSGGPGQLEKRQDHVPWSCHKSPPWAPGVPQWPVGMSTYCFATQHLKYVPVPLLSPPCPVEGDTIAFHGTDFVRVCSNSDRFGSSIDQWLGPCSRLSAHLLSGCSLMASQGPVGPAQKRRETGPCLPTPELQPGGAYVRGCLGVSLQASAQRNYLESSTTCPHGALCLGTISAEDWECDSFSKPLG